MEHNVDPAILAGDDSPSLIPSMEGDSFCTLTAPPTHVPPLFSLSCVRSRFYGVATVYLRCFSCCTFIVAIICFFVFQLLLSQCCSSTAFFEMLKYVSVTSISCCSSCFMLLQ
ncbi:hypothetical protein BDA96_04G172200 [Sorghum bicolor]|uniref:Uncharacterized protein n=1 Tax=Sorghum bicolor TaxID=4558 RepID=A0A921R3C6_SORBI|nr:hypothetical protein BDA96_04G172200 [Sorghum bicolor]